MPCESKNVADNKMTFGHPRSFLKTPTNTMLALCSATPFKSFGLPLSFEQFNRLTTTEAFVFRWNQSRSQTPVAMKNWQVQLLMLDIYIKISEKKEREKRFVTAVNHEVKEIVQDKTLTILPPNFRS
ncbi:hypothetical protein NPIL_85491 [Nephila pilipes]|uniref:Uncharacterized protein n=1 Tax=Nephila pilipes TaxID=299642 RepID=A0A8X6PGT6_NEPPI|nr:hypothetical protein NPIL_85491 [Nephila pilipes]